MPIMSAREHTPSVPAAAPAARLANNNQIAPLSDQTSAAMRAHLRFPTLSVLALGLLHNALDAGARRISLTLDFGAWALACEDDGRGFARSFFVGGASSSRDGKGEQGRGGGMLFYGRGRGGLRMMAHLGRLHVQSVPETAQREAYALIQKGDECIFSGRDPDQASNYFRRGSKVTLSDLFSQLPVRRRSLDTHAKRKAEVERLKRAVTVASLREPHVVFIVKLRDSSERGIDSHPEAKEVLHIPKATSLQARLRGAYRQHSLPLEDIVEISGCTSEGDQVAVSGLISLSPVYTREIQHVFLNKHLLETGSNVAEQFHHKVDVAGLELSPHTSPRKSALREKIAEADADLHSAVRNVFQRNLNFRHGSNSSRPPSADRSRPEGTGGSPIKARGLHACFVIDITVRLEHAAAGASSSGTGPAADRVSVKNIVERAVEDRLWTRGLLLGSDRTQTAAPHHWSEVERPAGTEVDAQDGIDHLRPARKRRIVASVPPTAEPSLPPVDLEASFTRYTDEVTGATYCIDCRTGNSYLADRPPTGKAESAFPPSTPDGNCQCPQSEKSGFRKKDQDQSASLGTSRPAQSPAWLLKSIRSWSNPTLPLQGEADIPDAQARTLLSSLAPVRARRESALALPVIQAHSRFFPQKHGATDISRSTLKNNELEELSPTQLEGCLDKSSLRSARVVGQVDRKFVLCVVEIPRGNAAAPRTEALLMIDQHAADERVRVERLLAAMMRRSRDGDPARYTLRQPVLTDIGTGEVNGLKDNGDVRMVLDKVGFEYTMVEEQDSAPDAGTTLKLLVSAVPDVIKDRLAADYALITALIRSFLALGSEDQGLRALLLQLSGDTVPSSAEGAPGEQRCSWIGLLRTMPKLMLDLIFSRACRGAIMFNDILTQEQCKRLVKELADTAFPFQCAHGRPSMLPLVLLPSTSSYSLSSGVKWESLLDDNPRHDTQ